MSDKSAVASELSERAFLDSLQVNVVGALPIGKAAPQMLAPNLAVKLADTNICVATTAIQGALGQNDPSAPERCAEVFWQEHQDEVVYT